MIKRDFEGFFLEGINPIYRPLSSKWKKEEKLKRKEEKKKREKIACQDKKFRKLLLKKKEVWFMVYGLWRLMSINISNQQRST